MRKIRLLIIFVLIGFISLGVKLVQDTTRGPGDWVHVPLQGIDSRIGRFKSESKNLEIKYDIGRMAGNYAQSRKEKADALWYKEGFDNKAPYQYTLDQNNQLTVTFPNSGPENYRVILNKESETEYVLDLLLRSRQFLLKQ